MQKVCFVLFKRSLVISFFAFLTAGAQAQHLDTSQLFSFEAYLEWVRQYHPVAKQGNLLNEQANAAERVARGGFDPKVYANIDHKSFDGKNYYRIGESGLKVPTWFGAQLKAGYLWSDGVFLNPENQLPIDGQAVIGVELSLLQGLVIDERRTALQQAKLVADVNEAERRRIVNDLLFEAATVYWEWAYAAGSLVIRQEAQQLAEQRFAGIRESFLQGDKPAIDTLEALIQVQTRQFEVAEAILDYRNAGLALSNHLWYDNDIPVEVTGALRPSSLGEIIEEPAFVINEELLQNIASSQPELLVYRYKLSQLEIERRLKLEKFKPKLDVSYNFLGDGFDLVNRPAGNFENDLDAVFTENYKLGLAFSFPLFLRKERGDLQLTDVKINQTGYHYVQKQLELSNKVRAYRQQLETTREQIARYEEIIANYSSLLAAENEKFRIGESSIFLLNSREQKLIEARLKLAKLLAEYRKSYAGMLWAAGRL